MHDAMRNYLFQIFYQDGTTEYALPINFEFGLQAKIPLGTAEKLNMDQFPIPFCFLYGDNDWVCQLDDGFSKSISQNCKCGYMDVPDAGHNMHMDNP